MKRVTRKAILSAVIIALICVILGGARRARGEVGPDRSGRGPSAQTDDTTFRKAVWSPDGTLLAIATPDDVRIYSAERGNVRVLADVANINELVFSADSRLLAAWEDEPDTRLIDRRPVIHVWEVATGAHLAEWDRTRPYAVANLAFSPDNTLIAMNGAHTSGEAYQMGVILWRYTSQQTPIFTSVRTQLNPDTLAFSPDQSMIATPSYTIQNGSGVLFAFINIFSVETGAAPRELPGVTGGGEIERLSFLPQNNTVLVAQYSTGVVRLWNVQTGEMLFALTQPYDLHRIMAVSPNGALIATTGEDLVVRVWDTATGALLDVRPSQGTAITQMAITDTGMVTAYHVSWEGAWQLDVSGERNDTTPHVTAPVFNAEPNAAPITPLENPRLIQANEGIVDLVWSPDGSQLVAPSWGETYLFDLTSESLARRELPLNTTYETFFEIPADGIRSAVFSYDGHWLATGQDNGVAQIWEMATLKPITAFQGNTFSVESLAFNLDSTRLAVGGGYFPARSGSDYDLHVWDTASWSEIEFERVRRFTQIEAVAYNRDNALIAYGGSYYGLTICDAETGELLTIIHKEPHSVHHIAFSPDGRFLAFSSMKSVELWELRHEPEFHLILRQRWTFNELYQVYWEWDEWPLTNIAFREDGHMLFATSTATGAIRVWDARSNAIIAEVAQAGAAIWTASFDPEGKRLAAADERGTIYIWTLPNLDD